MRQLEMIQDSLGGPAEPQGAHSEIGNRGKSQKEGGRRDGRVCCLWMEEGP